MNEDFYGGTQMERCLNIILVEDDMNTCKNFVHCVDAVEEIKLVNLTNNSYKALELVKEHLPDAIILDLELNEGGGNGLLFLKGLKELNLAIKPFILVTTNNSSNIMYEYARQLGADFIMAKHQEDYSEQKVIEFLTMMKEVIQNNQQSQSSDCLKAESSHEQMKRLNRMITLELDNIGISPKVVGYKYLIDAITYVFNDEKSNLCSRIGEKYGKTDVSVERAMQNAINKAWRSNDIDELLKYYTAKINSEKGVPTLTEFIYYYATKIKNNS